MNSISDLRDYFKSKNIEVISSGWFMKCGIDVWTMMFGDYYCNGIIKTKKDIDQYCSNPPKSVRRSIKMIRPSDFIFIEEELVNE